MEFATHLQTGRGRAVLWSAWVVLALLLLEVAQGVAYGLLASATALAVALVPGHCRRSRWSATFANSS